MLFVASGGINRAWKPTLPTSLGVMLGLLIEIGADEFDRVHSLYIAVKAVDTASTIARVEGGAQIGDSSVFEAGESGLLPAAIDLRPVAIEAYGQYDVHIGVDGAEPIVLSFWIKPRPQPTL
jgi:hypothetical protein